MPRPARPLLPLALLSGLGLGMLLGVTPSLAAAPAGDPGVSSGASPQQGEAQAPSNPSQIGLADHLRARGVLFYGAYWCPHCMHQKLAFGQEASQRLPYVECARDLAGAQACEAAGVTAYPTWVMGKDRRVGFQTLEELAVWTLYRGPADFSRQGPAATTTSPPPAGRTTP